jgi:hypothetical protein
MVCLVLEPVAAAVAASASAAGTAVAVAAAAAAAAARDAAAAAAFGARVVVAAVAVGFAAAAAAAAAAAHCCKRHSWVVGQKLSVILTTEESLRSRKPIRTEGHADLNLEELRSDERSTAVLG